MIIIFLLLNTSFWNEIPDSHTSKLNYVTCKRFLIAWLILFMFELYSVSHVLFLQQS